MTTQNARTSFDGFTDAVARVKESHLLPAYVVVRAAQQIYDADAKRFPGRDRLRKQIENENLQHIILRTFAWDHMFEPLIDVGCVRTIDSNGTFIVAGSMGDLSAAIRERCVLSNDTSMADFVLRHGLDETKCPMPLARTNTNVNKRARCAASIDDAPPSPPAPAAAPPTVEDVVDEDADASRIAEEAIARVRATLATHIINIELECADIITRALKLARTR